MAVKIGVDTGGTFTDFILMDGEQLTIHQVLSTPDKPACAVLQGLRYLLLALTGVNVVHGSTVATNALLERKGARTALITTSGFEDILEIGHQTRPDLFELFVTNPTPHVQAARHCARGRRCRPGVAAGGGRSGAPGGAQPGWGRHKAVGIPYPPGQPSIDPCPSTML